jgi:hypothetical protein
VVEVHVEEALGLVVGTGAEVFVHRGNEQLHIRRKADRRVHQAGGQDEIVEQPHVAPFAVGNVPFERELSADEAELGPLAYDAWATLAHRCGQLAFPQVAGFEDVVVDRDDPRQRAHCRRGGNLRIRHAHGLSARGGR